jgi:ligand-binding SRPBCC domain-containing protein
MAIHVLRTSQEIPTSLEACWAFFSDPQNLARITPASLDFHILSALPATIYPGMMIEYRVRPLFGVPVTWLTEITQVAEARYFVDEQRVGPYAIWHHEHHFRALDEGRTEVRDTIHYVPPFGPIGEILHPWLIAPQLVKIFAFREQAVARLFPPAGT